MPNQSADDPILAADLRRWAADQVGPAVAERGDEPLRDRHDPRQPLLDGLPRSGTGSGADHGPDHAGPATDHRPVPLTDRREETG